MKQKPPSNRNNVLRLTACGAGAMFLSAMYVTPLATVLSMPIPHEGVTAGFYAFALSPFALGGIALARQTWHEAKILFQNNCVDLSTMLDDPLKDRVTPQSMPVSPVM